MKDLFKEAAQFQFSIESEGLDFFFVGGIAVQVWGEPRLTLDIDLTVFTDLVEESKTVSRLLSICEPRDMSREAAEDFSKISRMLLLRTDSGTDIDIMLGGISDISEELSRASMEPFTDEISLRVCSASTLVAMKTIAGRPKDIFDLESILIKQTDLDWDYISDYLGHVQEYEDIRDKVLQLETLRSKYYRP